jgi:tetratricopeptide (TPR) repeat protein
MRITWGTILAGVFCCLGPANIAAQPKQKISAEDMKKAKARFGEAESFYRVGDYARALEAYKEAYLLSKKPGILFNMAQCYRYTKNYREAIKTYQLFLHDAPNTEFREEVEGFIAELEALLEAEARAASQPASVIVEPSTQPTSAPQSQPGPMVIFLPAEMSSQPPSYQGPGGALFFGAAGVGGVTALFLGGVALARANEANELQQEQISDPNDPRVEEAVQAYSRAQSLGVASDLLFVTSIAAAGVGSYFFWQKRKFEASVEAKRNSVSVRVSF